MGWDSRGGIFLKVCFLHKTNLQTPSVASQHQSPCRHYLVDFFTCTNNCYHLEKGHKVIGSPFFQAHILNELNWLIARKEYSLILLFLKRF